MGIQQVIRSVQYSLTGNAVVTLCGLRSAVDAVPQEALLVNGDPKRGARLDEACSTPTKGARTSACDVF